MHLNEQLREAAKVQLEARGFASIFSNPGAAVTDAELPAVILETSTDVVEERTKNGLERRLVTLRAVLVADGDSETLDDDLDDLRIEAEAALAESIGEVTSSVQHDGGELDIGTDEDGERWYGFYTLTWTVEVWTRAGQPQTALAAAGK